MKVVRAVCLCLLALVVAAPASAATPANLPQLARSLVKEGAPGAIVYLRTPTATRSGVAGFADRSARRTMRASYRYRIASVSKAFVSVVVLQLEAEGKLDIDDPVEKFLPGTVPNGAAITLRELLNHTSGLFNYTDDDALWTAILANPSRAWNPRELTALAFTHAPYFAPGTNWYYSNTNYVVLGLVVEKVSGKALGESLQERIFTPLQLTSTSFPAGTEIDETFVHGYLKLGDGPLVDLTQALSPTWAWAAGGIVSNAADVTTFYRALLTGRLLPPAQLAEMKDAPAVAAAYALGISVTSTACGRAYGHDGDFPGWRNTVWATANGARESVVMINVDESYVTWDRLHTIARRALCKG